MSRESLLRTRSRCCAQAAQEWMTPPALHARQLPGCYVSHLVSSITINDDRISDGTSSYDANWTFTKSHHPNAPDRAGRRHAPPQRDDAPDFSSLKRSHGPTADKKYG